MKILKIKFRETWFTPVSDNWLHINITYHALYLKNKCVYIIIKEKCDIAEFQYQL